MFGLDTEEKSNMETAAFWTNIRDNEMRKRCTSPPAVTLPPRMISFKLRHLQEANYCHRETSQAQTETQRSGPESEPVETDTEHQGGVVSLSALQCNDPGARHEKVTEVEIKDARNVSHTELLGSL